MTRQQFQTILIFLFVLIFGTLSCRQTSNKETQINHADSLKQDFTIFRNILQDYYPSLYRYADKVKMDHLFDSCYASINSMTTELEFLKTIKFLLSSIKDGHSYCSPSTTLRQYLEEKV